MSRYLENAHHEFAELPGGRKVPVSVVPAVATLKLMNSGDYVPVGDPGTMSTFVVKLRNVTTCSWGDQVEMVAASAEAAAERASGELLLASEGVRSDLRVRVWPTPFGSKPDRAFYLRPGTAH